jgi:hypothetical protein
MPTVLWQSMAADLPLRAVAWTSSPRPDSGSVVQLHAPVCALPTTMQEEIAHEYQEVLSLVEELTLPHGEDLQQQPTTRGHGCL